MPVDWSEVFTTCRREAPATLDDVHGSSTT
jgi:hypothetical protein